MNCREAIPLIHEYLDGNISEDKLVLLNKHLLHCRRCKHHFQELQQTEAFIGGLYPDVPSPLHLKEKIMNGLPKEKPNKRWFFWIKRHPKTAAFFVLFVLFFGGYMVFWDLEKTLVVKSSGMDQVVIRGEKVIVPEGAIVHGDLFVEDGTTDIRGTVKGNLVLVNGDLHLASTAHITGKVTRINQAIEWIWYNINRWVQHLGRIMKRPFPQRGEFLLAWSIIRPVKQDIILRKEKG